jgi:hypothetical protein
MSRLKTINHLDKVYTVCLGIHKRVAGITDVLADNAFVWYTCYLATPLVTRAIHQLNTNLVVSFSN